MLSGSRLARKHVNLAADRKSVSRQVKVEPRPQIPTTMPSSSGSQMRAAALDAVIESEFVRQEEYY